MMFAKRLRQGIREGRITCPIRIWQRPHVKVGGVYPMEDPITEDPESSDDEPDPDK
jgi:hypothetical protein